MSPRTVHFTHRQLLWECKSSLRCEDGVLEYTVYNEPTFANTTIKLESEHYIPAWQRIVREYSRLDLTFRDVRLPAVAAIVEDMMKRREDDFYMAGMWVNSLVADLTWYIDTQTRAFKGLLPKSHQLSPSRAWTSVQGPIKFSDYRGCLPSVEVLDTSGSARQAGRVKDASITMRGPAIEAIFKDGQYLQTGERMSHTVHHAHHATASHTRFEVYGAERSKDFDVETGGIQGMENGNYIFFFVNTDKLFCCGLIPRRLSDTECERVETCWCQTDPYTFNETQRAVILKRYIDGLIMKEVKII